MGLCFDSALASLETGFISGLATAAYLYMNIDMKSCIYYHLCHRAASDSVVTCARPCLRPAEGDRAELEHCGIMSTSCWRPGCRPSFRTTRERAWSWHKTAQLTHMRPYAV